MINYILEVSSISKLLLHKYWNLPYIYPIKFTLYNTEDPSTEIIKSIM